MFHRQDSLAASMTNRLADTAAQSADETIGSTRRVASDVLDRLRRGAGMMRERSQQLRDGAHRASDHTVSYIREEPLKSVLIAAAAGAAMVALANYMSRHRR